MIRPTVTKKEKFAGDYRNLVRERLSALGYDSYFDDDSGGTTELVGNIFDAIGNISSAVILSKSQPQVTTSANYRQVPQAGTSQSSLMLFVIVLAVGAFAFFALRKG